MLTRAELVDAIERVVAAERHAAAAADPYFRTGAVVTARRFVVEARAALDAALDALYTSPR